MAHCVDALCTVSGSGVCCLIQQDSNCGVQYSTVHNIIYSKCFVASHSEVLLCND